MTNPESPMTPNAHEANLQSRITQFTTHPITRCFKGIFYRYQQSPEYQATWEQGIAPEVAFWDDHIHTEGSLWPDDYQARMDPALPLQDHIREAFDVPEGTTLEILDVGAGPLTYLGKVWPGRTLNITAIDPLAEEYAAIFQRYQRTPPLPTQLGYAERLIGQFGENRFDLVHARNCIDHSHDPVLAIEQMVAVTKPGGLVYLHHAVNEAEIQQYHGFHQWNLHGTAASFYVSNPTCIVNMSFRLAAVADVSNQLSVGNTWIITQIYKRHPTTLLRRLRQQIRSCRRTIFDL